MSYILDALRKADAQRQRDPARGIHAQPLGASAIGRAPRGGRGMRVWLAAAVGLAALSSGAWYLYRGHVHGASVRHVEGAVRAPASLTTLAQAQTAPVPGRNGAAINPAPVINPPPAPASAATPSRDARSTAQQPMRSAPQSPGSAAAPVPGARPPTTARTPAMQMPRPTAPNAFGRTPPVSPPVASTTLSPPVAGLPPDAPKLVLGGGVYSANPAQRMLIVNGQVFNEGSEVAPGVTLEEMKARTVVLRFHGARYTVAY